MSTQSPVSVRPRVLLMATHPIQYQVPWFQALAQQAEIDFSVLFVQLPDAQQQGVGFGVAFEWDIPLLEGYQRQPQPALAGKSGSRGFFAKRLLRPAALLRSLKADILILTGWQAWPLLQMLIAAKLQGVPVIMRGESNALRNRPWAVRCLHSVLLRACQVMLTIGQGNRAFYKAYDVPDRQLFSAPYYVDNARFSVAALTLAPQRAALRQRWQIPAGAVCFLFAGKLEPKKCILDLLTALQ